MKPGILRTLICLLLICCLIIHISPVRAKALAVADDIAIGITACLILMAAGVVFAPNTVADITAIGNSMSTYMYQWGTEAEKSDEVESWLGGLTIYNGGSDEDGDGVEDTPRDRQVQLARGILGSITAWVASVIMGTSGVSVSAGDGYRFYGDHLLPFPLPDTVWSNGNAYLFWNPTMGKYYFYELPTYFLYNVSENKLSTYDTINKFRRYICTPGDSSWTFEGTTTYEFYYSYSLTLGVDLEFLWGSRTISYDSESGSGFYYVYGTKTPQTAKSLAVSKYLGDIPSQIQDGTLTADDITLPDVLDYSELVPLGKPATDAVIDTSNDLIDGTLPYEDYLQQITGDAVTGVSIVSPDTVTAGSYITIQADVSGSGDFDTACTCTLSGAVSADTVLTASEYDNTWSLTCGADETAETLTVTVQSVADASITAVKEIAVRESGSTAPSEGADTSPDYSEDLDNIGNTLQDVLSGIGSLPQSITDGLSGILDQQQSDAESTGQGSVDDIINVIPDDSQGFLDALGTLTDALSYEGTSAVLVMPAIKVPTVGSVFLGFTVLEEQSIDFEYYFNKMPFQIMSIVKALFDIAIVVFCVREFLAVLGGFVNGFTAFEDGLVNYNE